MFKLVEKANPLAVHGIFDTKLIAEEHLKNKIPIYCQKGYFMNKTLKPDSFEVLRY